MKKYILLIVSFFLFSGLLFSQEITKENWLEDSYINEVRELYLYTENHVTNNDFTVFTKNIISYDGYDLNTNCYIDENMVIRKIEYLETRDDGFLKISLYYDKDLALRFVFISTKEKAYEADNNEVILNDYRVYFDTKGEIIWKVLSRMNIYILFGNDVDISKFEEIINKCPYEIFHDVN